MNEGCGRDEEDETRIPEILRYGNELPDHVVICTHADNTPAQEVPVFKGDVSQAQLQSLRSAKAQNRRITIEDKLINNFESE